MCGHRRRGKWMATAATESKFINFTIRPNGKLKCSSFRCGQHTHTHTYILHSYILPVWLCVCVEDSLPCPCPLHVDGGLQAGLVCVDFILLQT